MREYKHTIATRCKFCRNLFNSFNLSKICPACEENMEQYVEQVKLYISDFPGSDYIEVAQALDLSASLVRHILREEMLQTKSDNGEYVLRCVICGKPVSKGTLCFLCEVEEARKKQKAPEEKRARAVFHGSRRKNK